MPGDHQSRSDRIGLALHKRCSLTILCATILASGCVTPEIFFPINSDRSDSKSHEVTLVRSQDSPLQEDVFRTADSTSTKPFSSQPDPAMDRSRQTSVRPVSGHAFAQPKARLGRPMPMSRASQSGVPSVGHSEIPDQGRFPSNSSRAQGASASPWNAGVSGWQSGTATSAALPNSRPSVGTIEASINNPAEFQNSGSMLSAQPAAASTSGEVGQTSGGLNTETVENGASSELEQPVAPTEPTMLDRLRGLYNPRIDENTDKLRKQIRRWPDPFGLLKDREEPAMPGPENDLLPEGTESGAQTADLNVIQQPPTTEATPENSHIQLAIQELEAELAAWPQKISGEADRAAEWRQKQTDLRLLYMIAGKSAESVRIIESLPEEEQEFWQSLMMSMNSYRDNSDDVDRTEQLTESLRHLRTASKKLQPLSRLTIQRAMLCDRIDGFGNVVAFPTSNFEPGQRVLVYTELQNFQSELTDDGKYRSEFAARIEFMREGDDEILEKIQVLQIEDLCDVERTDYFQSFELTLPALEGKYHMRILLRDYFSQQVAESSLQFSVRSQSGGP